MNLSTLSLSKSCLLCIGLCLNGGVYLEGTHFKVITDHKPNTFINSKGVLNRCQARWMEYISRFEFDWEYCPGKVNAADPSISASHILLSEIWYRLGI